MADDFGQTIQGLHLEGDSIVATDQHIGVFGEKSGVYQYLQLDTNDALIIGDGGNAITVTATDLDIRDLTQATDSVSIGDGTNLVTINADNGLEVHVNNTVTVTATDLDIRDLVHTQDSVAIGDGTDLLDINADGSLNVVTNIEYDEDAAHTTGDTGAFVLAVRNDAGTSLVSADGDYAPLQVDSSGALRVAATVNISRDDSTHTYGSVNATKDTIVTVVTDSPGSTTAFIGVMLSAPGLCEWNIEFGTTSSEAIIMKVWTTPSHPTEWIPFPEKLDVDSGETIRVRATNRENAASPASDMTAAATLINT
jgi:hypothetical protein